MTLPDPQSAGRRLSRRELVQSGGALALTVGIGSALGAARALPAAASTGGLSATRAAIYLAATDALADVDPAIQRSSSAATLSEAYGAMPRVGRDQVDHLLDALDHGKPGSFAARTRAQRTAFLRRAVNGFDGRAEDAHPCATIRCALDFVAATASPSRSASSVGPVGYLAGAS